MPSFDQEAALRRAQTDQAKLKSLEFAHKFDVQLRPENSGVTFSHAGMNVWRVGIRSKGAYSINLLFSKFRLPEGAKVFIYNTHQTEVLGAYTHENNSDLNLLPVQPIGGEELIVEYQVPLHSTDKGEIEIGDVNHDFLGLFRGREPRDPQQSCHPNIVCYPEDIQPGSGCGSTHHQRHLLLHWFINQQYCRRWYPLPADRHPLSQFRLQRKLPRE